MLKTIFTFLSSQVKTMDDMGCTDTPAQHYNVLTYNANCTYAQYLLLFWFYSCTQVRHIVVCHVCWTNGVLERYKHIPLPFTKMVKQYVQYVN